MVEFPIDPNETLHTFIVRSMEIACDAVLRAIDKVEHGGVMPRPLNTSAGSYFGYPTRTAYRELRRRGRRLW